ncbi:hypothetical protein CPC08DRAFT_49520 [Agrocybe pediades]|nr:hypothetical protein CPC08DRAFT_49520 [Agrocybe pediades]
MLRRARRPPPRLLYRSLSSSPYDGTFNKLRAFPFRMSPEQAQREMAKWGSIINDGEKFIGSLLAPFVPFVDYQRPLRITPVYFPAWLVNAFIKAEVKHHDVKPTASIIFRNTFIPGAAVPLLSNAPLWPRDLDNREPEPFSEDMMTQYGQEVQCIPFNISPFSILDIAKTSEDPSWSITDGLKVTPQSIEPRLLSVSPILFPVYLAQYKTREREDGSGHDLVTMFIQAHSSDGIVMSELSEEFERIPGGVFEKLVSQSPAAGIAMFGDTTSRVGIGGLSLRPINEARDAICSWLDEYLDSYSDIQKLSSMGYLETDDDPRIRELTLEEQDGLTKYFEITAEIAMVRRIIRSMEETQNAKAVVLTISKGQLPHLEAADKAATTLKTKLKELEEAQKKALPEWWTEWRRSQGLESEVQDDLEE